MLFFRHWKHTHTNTKLTDKSCCLAILLILLLSDRHNSLCDLFTCPAFSVCSVVNKMLALKGENNCKYKHGEVHLELEQTCFSDSLTVTWGWNRSRNHSPTGHTLSCFVWLILSQTHTHKQTHMHKHNSPQRGQAGKEAVSGWAAVRSSRNIRMFPLQQTASISGDRQTVWQSDSPSHWLTRTCTDAQWLTQR